MDITMQPLPKTFSICLQQSSRIIVCAILLSPPVFAQQAYPPAQADAYRAINQKSITATVSFLSSDEMAGRDTPSRELQIASAYVAARFRGAGLSGGGDESTFYQSTQIATYCLSSTGIDFERNGKPLAQRGLLSANAKPFSYAGSLTFIARGADVRGQKFDGPVYLDVGEFKEPAAIANLTRLTHLLKQNGATAILVATHPTDPIIGVAHQKLSPSIVRPLGEFAGPAMLVAPLEADGADAGDAGDGAEAGEFRIEIPAIIGGEATVRNVIGVLPGSDPELSKEAIIFSAHLDHIGHHQGSTLGGDQIFNGGDDNASGVTAVLTLADAFAALPNRPKRTLIFMTFWGEEKGLLGSRHYVQNPTWPLDKIIANINIEMIGRPEPGAHEKVWMTGWEHSDLGKLMSVGSATIGVQTFQHPQFSEMLYRASDNYSFVEKGVIAHSFSAGSLHNDYHQVTDEWEKLNLRHMTRVIEGLFAGSLPIAHAEVTPAKSTPKNPRR